MNKEEQVGWVGMTIGLVITFLPFISSFFGISFNPAIIVVSIIGVAIFLIGATKALPEILFATFGHNEQPQDTTSKLPINNSERLTK